MKLQYQYPSVVKNGCEVTTMQELHNYFSTSLIKAIFGTAIFASGLLAGDPAAWGNPRTRIIVLHEAVGVFERIDHGSQTSMTSNEVTLKIEELTGVPPTNSGRLEAPTDVN
jgi:hypothetical protein